MYETATPADSPPRAWRSALWRLWTLRPVRSLPSGNPLRANLVLAAALLAFWAVIDRWQSQPEPQFFAGGIPLLAWYALAILGLAALLRSRARPKPAFGPMLTLALGAVPVPLALASGVAFYVDSSWLLGLGLAVGVYTLLYFARGLHAITGVAQRTAAFAGFAFLAGFVWLTDILDVIPDVWTPAPTQASEPGRPADGEAALFGQANRIDESMAAIVRGSSSQPQSFFLGFAGVGAEKVFAQEIRLASQVLTDRYDLGARSLSLINDERDLESGPIATVSGFKYALRRLGSRMNLDRDVLFLSISSHGAEDRAIIVSNADLPLQDLTDEDLADALRESGIKWRVIIISACYAGGFIDSLRDPQTIVITAAAADRTSFGCSNDRELTYFGEAFYRDALPTAPSLHDAFDAAKAAIALRERHEHVTPSNPQAYFGRDMQAKLDAIERKSGAAVANE
jgi:hypothetical protein